ncbi:response regulator [Actinocatenispora comari]|jgi:DNA-binding NarL/FixJ family response regulator|uniref:DNA-binding response regulator n=1 Tax=Actinocatenispora comari TaxID=2807577 RepID=A0A8J4AGZ9_9ACTN|nr:response regulator transcription factor [Actinocatenispora comari]GIL31126.1 DNA-binding response regulator [Actinocatenispora comari]
MTEPVRIVVADDQTAVREGLATMLDLLPDVTVVATAPGGVEAVAAVAAHAPDVVLMDLHMPGMDGVTATRQIAAEHPDTRVVVLTTFADDQSVLAGLRAGAIGYLTKEAGRDEIARAVHAAAAGQGVLDADVQRRLVAATATPIPPVPAGRELPDGLTPREGEVLALIAAGLTNREIATELYVSEATVKTHINNLFTKARLRDRAQAVRYAYQHGIVPPER